MNKDLLVICPTRERPVSCQKMIDSFKKNTSKRTELIFIVDADDPCIKEYEYMFARTNHFFFTRETCSLPETYNLIVLNWFQDYSFYSITNDDFVYHTKNWDKILIQKLEEKNGGFAYGDDGFGGQNLPTTCIISSEIIKALGWIVLPTLTYLCGDLVWKEIGLRLNKLFYMPEVSIEHMHPLAGKAEKDDTFNRTNSQESYTRDHKAFREWKSCQMKIDIEKIQEVLCNQK